MTTALSVPLDVRLMNITASVLFVVFLLSVLALGGKWLQQYPGFAIGRIIVQGDLVHNSALSLRANVAPHLSGNFFSLDLAAAREAFEHAPWVRVAQVRREFPNRLHVTLQEHEAVAHWGGDGSGMLVNRQGEVFEADASLVEPDRLPRLRGPKGQAVAVLHMQQVLAPVFTPIGMQLDELELSDRGGWRATLDSSAVVELGGGSEQAVLERAQRFVRTLPEVVAKYQRRVDALETADLRHEGGYALRLRGVSTLAADAPPTKQAPKAAAPASKKSTRGPH